MSIRRINKNKLFSAIKDPIAHTAFGTSRLGQRSVQDGFVHWHAGGEGTNEESRCERIAGVEHWPELRAMVIVADEREKRVGSTEGMRLTARTSELLKARVARVVPKRIEA